LWNHFTRIYDEKPEQLKASIKQRTRWAQGHWYVAFTRFIPFVKKVLFERGKIQVLDQLFYLFSMSRSVHLLLSTIGIILSVLFAIINKEYNFLSNLGVQLVGIIFGSSILTLIG